MAAGEFVILDDEITLLVVGPIGVFRLGERRCGNADEGSGNDGVRW